MKLINAFVKFIVILVLINFSACKTNNEEKARIFKRQYLEPIKKARRDLFFHLSSNYIPGGSVALAIDGELIWSEGMGYASKELNVPASRDTRYRIGEISQVLTGLAYNILIEKGELHPDSTVNSYLPEFPKKKYDITLQDLANQGSGFRQSYSDEVIAPNLGLSIQKGLDFFANDSLLFEPGFMQYNTIFNYNLLGAIIEKKTNKRFKDVIKNLIIDTLGLTSIVPDNPAVEISNRSNFFDYNIIAQIINASTTDFGFSLPSIGYLATAEDIVKLGNSFLNSDYITESIKSRIFKVDKYESGLLANWNNGWYINTDNKGRDYWACQGNVKGTNTILLIYPEYKFVFAIATNLSGNFDELPVFSLAQYFIDFIDPPEETEEN